MYRQECISFIENDIITKAMRKWEQFKHDDYKVSESCMTRSRNDTYSSGILWDHSFEVKDDGKELETRIRAALEAGGACVKQVKVRDGDEWYGFPEVSFKRPPIAFNEFISKPGGNLVDYISDLHLDRKANGFQVICNRGKRAEGDMYMQFNVDGKVLANTCPVPSSSYGVCVDLSKHDLEIGVRVIGSTQKEHKKHLASGLVRLA